MSPTPPRSRRTGRRPGSTNTRQDIVTAARKLFAERGYDATSVRAVSREAGVDPALVHHFFGSKEGLFRVALEDVVRPAMVTAKVVQSDMEDAGERLVRAFLGLWDNAESGGAMLALLRSAVSHQDAADMLGGFMTREVLGRIVDETDAEEQQMRVSLVASQLAGLALVRYVLCLEPLASADSDMLAASVGPTLQRYLLGSSGDLVGA